MNYAKLRGRITEKFETDYNFAVAMGMDRVSLSHRLTGKVQWKTAEIIKACILLEISTEEIGEYFFTPKSQENLTESENK